MMIAIDILCRSPTRTPRLKTVDISQDQRGLWLFFRPGATGAPGFLRSRADRSLIVWWRNSKNSDGEAEEAALASA